MRRRRNAAIGRRERERGNQVRHGGRTSIAVDGSRDAELDGAPQCHGRQVVEAVAP